MSITAPALDRKHTGYQGGGYRQLAAGILYHAVRDAERAADPATRLEARSWLLGDPVARFLQDALGLPRPDVVRWVLALEPVALEALDGGDGTK